MNKYFALEKRLGRGRIKKKELMAKHTTLGVGGPAEYFYEAKSSAELIKAIEVSRKLKLPLFILGAGSNIIVGGKGIRGLVVKNLTQDFFMKPFEGIFTPRKIKPRLKKLSAHQDGVGVHAMGLGRPGADLPRSKELFLVTASSGWRLADLINHCLKKGLVGLEQFAGIPGSLGGAVYMNIHGGPLFFSDYLYQVEVWDLARKKEKIIKYKDLDLAYDYSIFHKKNRPILSASLVLAHGDRAKAQLVKDRWLKEKVADQPQRSCGCIWQNLSFQEEKSLGLPTPSIGYIVDKVLALKGRTRGGAQISPKHAGFIENVENAKAGDVLELLLLVEKEAKNKLGVVLKREAILIGEF